MHPVHFHLDHTPDTDHPQMAVTDLHGRNPTMCWPGVSGDDPDGRRWTITAVDGDTVELARPAELPPEAWADLKDPQKAQECLCSCHPRPAKVSLHDGGRTCQCQLTAAQRKAAFDKLLETSSELGETMRTWENERLEAAERRWGDDDGVHFDVYTWMAPLQITGTVDGQAFYLRERHGMWSLDLIGAGGNPRHDAGETIAEGTDRDWPEPKETTWLAQIVGDVVHRIRDRARRQACTHPRAERFCPQCGERIDPHDS